MCFCSSISKLVCVCLDEFLYDIKKMALEKHIEALFKSNPRIYKVLTVINEFLFVKVLVINYDKSDG